MALWTTLCTNYSFISAVLGALPAAGPCQYHPCVDWNRSCTQASVSLSPSLLLSQLSCLVSFDHHMFHVRPPQDTNRFTVLQCHLVHLELAFLHFVWDCFPVYFDSYHTLMLRDFGSFAKGGEFLYLFVHKLQPLWSVGSESFRTVSTVLGCT
jgi:hypothetical protein